MHERSVLRRITGEAALGTHPFTSPHGGRGVQGEATNAGQSPMRGDVNGCLGTGRGRVCRLSAPILTVPALAVPILVVPILVALVLTLLAAGAAPGWAASYGDEFPLGRPTVQRVLPVDGLTPASGPPPAAADSGRPGLAPRMAMSAPGVVKLEFSGEATVPREYAPEMYSRGFFGRMLDSMTYYMWYVWEWATSGISPPTPISFAQAYSDKDPDSFASLLSDAGYKLGEIETDVGIVPTVYFKFKNIRELSEADLMWLEQRLDKHARRNPGWVAAAQRSIVSTLLEINDSGDYFVNALKVRLLPLPAAEFTLEPNEGGLPEDLDVLLRAIQGKKISQRRGRSSSE